jgi:hypothetical protein
LRHDGLPSTLAARGQGPQLAEQLVSQPKEITMPASAARAIAAAWPCIVEEGAKSPTDLTRYDVLVVQHALEDEVIFVPQADAEGPTLGGRTSAGRELHCWVERVNAQVLRTSYAR